MTIWLVFAAPTVRQDADGAGLVMINSSGSQMRLCQDVCQVEFFHTTTITLILLLIPTRLQDLTRLQTQILHQTQIPIRALSIIVLYPSVICVEKSTIKMHVEVVLRHVTCRGHQVTRTYGNLIKPLAGACLRTTIKETSRMVSSWSPMKLRKLAFAMRPARVDAAGAGQQLTCSSGSQTQSYQGACQTEFNL